ncbi:DUF1175 family protein [Andreprevotia chitinilytica]|uniref:DUF1175 family protein n=1 Tax=Andreprevotia chitinilytica TaxID=396808 RepID=UPI0005569F6A|nr:DUF1175 family protein [Andreprevotia chitinilytica]
MKRRLALLSLLTALCLPAVHAADAELDATQAHAFRAWFVRLVSEQLRQGPTPRWQQRDCAGLVRFAVAEALREHDARWRKQNGIGLANLPPEVELSSGQRQALRHNWVGSDAKRSAYVPAFALIQHNSQLVSRDINQAQPGDLLFFDQGDDQHLMVWTGRYIAYHTGTVTPKDNGMRAVRVDQLMNWQDSRWRPSSDNPNFAGIYRLAFLPA